MKLRKFETPEIEIVDLEIADVVTTSMEDEEPTMFGGSCVS